MTPGTVSSQIAHSGFHAVDSRFQVLDPGSFSVELGFLIPIVSGMPDSLSCIPDSKDQDSRLHKRKFIRFQILQAKCPGFAHGFRSLGSLRLHSLCIPQEGKGKRVDCTNFWRYEEGMPIFSKAIDKPLRKWISLVSSSVKDVFVVDALTKLQCPLLCAVTNQLNIV